MHIYQLKEELAAVKCLAALNNHHQLLMVLRGADAVNARNARHYDDIVALQQGARRPQAELVYLLVD